MATANNCPFRRQKDVAYPATRKKKLRGAVNHADATSQVPLLPKTVQTWRELLPGAGPRFVVNSQQPGVVQRHIAIPAAVHDHLRLESGNVSREWAACSHADSLHKRTSFSLTAVPAAPERPDGWMVLLIVSGSHR